VRGGGRAAVALLASDKKGLAEHSDAPPVILLLHLFYLEGVSEAEIDLSIFAGVVSLTLLSGKTAAQTTAKASSVKEGIIKLADSNIEYFSRGEGETIVLLPGGTLTVDYLDGLAEELAKGGYRVVGINFRGSGKSTGPSTGVTLQTMANDVAGVIQALKLGSVHVVGNDFGNRVARVLDSSHPELTRSVILLAAGGKVPPKPPAARALNVIFNPASKSGSSCTTPSAAPRQRRSSPSLGSRPTRMSTSMTIARDTGSTSPRSSGASRRGRMSIPAVLRD
jgi:pimeloyl-ACP methyl ester carboxylesterase